ncbi:MAG TPA: hypothetical protein VLL08_31975, partial [Kineosporiaceae bacterium]|nr:hypothetical protein [Kineosporiaceae bacterium]
MRIRRAMVMVSAITLAAAGLIGGGSPASAIDLCETPGGIFVGTAGDDYLVGTEGRDLFFGLGG